MKKCYSVLLLGFEIVYFGLIHLEMLKKKNLLKWNLDTIACIVIICAFVVELKKIHY